MKTSRLLTKKQIAHSRYTRISNLLFIMPFYALSCHRKHPKCVSVSSFERTMEVRPLLS